MLKFSGANTKLLLVYRPCVTTFRLIKKKISRVLFLSNVKRPVNLNTSRNSVFSMSF